MTEDGYLQRTLDRIVDDGLSDIQSAVGKVTSEAAGRGALTNSRTALLYDQAVAEAYKNAIGKMASRAFLATGATGGEAANGVEVAGKKLIDRAADWLEKTFGGHGSFFVPPVAKLRPILLRILEEVVDDFRHGIHGERALKKDPFVSVVTNITDSPHAIQQMAIGDNNQLSVQQQTSTIERAIDDLLASDDYKQLNDTEKQLAVQDTADALRSELKNQAADPEKIKRWTHRLGAMAKEFGMHAAAFVKLAFGVLGLPVG
jgi:hypothetical protein